MYFPYLLSFKNEIRKYSYPLFLKCTFFVFLCVFYYCPSSYGETPCYGIDALGIAKTNPALIASELKTGMCLGFLQGTFGDAIPNVRKVLQSGKIRSWRMHLLNYTCIRNKNCEKTEPKLNDLEALKRRAIQAENLHSEFPSINCYVSPWLEYDVQDRATVTKWFEIVHTFAPSCTAIASPFTGFRPPGVLIEEHGNGAHGFSISNDGVSYFDSNSDKYKTQGTGLVFGWWNRLNLRTSGEEIFIPPSKRKAQVTRDELQQAVHTLTHSLSPRPYFAACPHVKELLLKKPPGMKQAEYVKNYSPGIWKTRSKDYNGIDVRENKAVLIVKPVVSNFKVITPSGKVVGLVKYYGAYKDLPGYSRYYVGSGSGQPPMRLFKDAGGEWVCLKSGNIQYAVSSLRRSGNYR